MTRFRADFEQYKSMINLSEYASSLGYKKDKKLSSKNSVCMRNSANDKVIISVDSSSGHYIYFSVRDYSDNGTIIDFVANRKGKGWDSIISELSPWVSSAPPISNINYYQKDILASAKDTQAIINSLSQMKIALAHHYLESVRGVNHKTLASTRFSGKVLIDSRKNAIFPHVDKNGACGYEMRNKNFKGFSTGGKKCLWTSNWFKTDQRLVICESAIDSLSYYQIKGFDNDRFFSTGGTSEKTFFDEILVPSIKYFKGDIVLAVDNDDGGDRFIQQIKEESSINDFVIDRPSSRGYDWNKELTDK